MNPRRKARRRRLLAALAEFAARFNERSHRVVTRDEVVERDGFRVRMVEWYDMRRRNQMNVTVTMLSHPPLPPGMAAAVALPIF